MWKKLEGYSRLTFLRAVLVTAAVLMVAVVFTSAGITTYFSLRKPNVTVVFTPSQAREAAASLAAFAYNQGTGRKTYAVRENSWRDFAKYVESYSKWGNKLSQAQNSELLYLAYQRSLGIVVFAQLPDVVVASECVPADLVREYCAQHNLPYSPLGDFFLPDLLNNGQLIFRIDPVSPVVYKPVWTVNIVNVTTQAGMDPYYAFASSAEQQGVEPWKRFKPLQLYSNVFRFLSVTSKDLVMSDPKYGGMYLETVKKVRTAYRLNAEQALRSQWKGVAYWAGMSGIWALLMLAGFSRKYYKEARQLRLTLLEAEVRRFSSSFPGYIRFLRMPVSKWLELTQRRITAEQARESRVRRQAEEERRRGRWNDKFESAQSKLPQSHALQSELAAALTAPDQSESKAHQLWERTKSALASEEQKTFVAPTVVARAGSSGGGVSAKHHTRRSLVNGFSGLTREPSENFLKLEQRVLELCPPGVLTPLFPNQDLRSTAYAILVGIWSPGGVARVGDRYMSLTRVRRRTEHWFKKVADKQLDPVEFDWVLDQLLAYNLVQKKKKSPEYVYSIQPNPDRCAREASEVCRAFYLAMQSLRK